MLTWHGGRATHISRCPPASTGLARPGTMAATGGERGGSGPGLPPGRSAAVCPFSSLGSESARATRARGKRGQAGRWAIGRVGSLVSERPGHEFIHNVGPGWLARMDLRHSVVIAL